LAVSCLSENAEVLARLKDISKGAAKKVIRRPQPKLDPTRFIKIIYINSRYHSATVPIKF